MPNLRVALYCKCLPYRYQLDYPLYQLETNPKAGLETKPMTANRLLQQFYYLSAQGIWNTPCVTGSAFTNNF